MTGMSIVAHLVAAVQPWADAYNDSTPLQALVMFAHIGGVVMSGGAAVTTDRATLAASRRTPDARAQALATLRASHRVILIGLGVVLASGLLLLAADLESLLGSTAFWVKMGLLTLLAVNGALLMRSERPVPAATDDAGARRQWRALTRRSVTSLVLWFALVLSSTVLVTSA
ncbi:MAG TPA: hypothetical protein VFV33_04410 [Gemmatimonadaceae bacterium]|nr:hypothetical protein [Gemmatimonadaceae bacterium]